MLEDRIQVTTDQDILSFLKYVYFGNSSNPVKAATNRAYLDMNRTLRFHYLPDNLRRTLREQVVILFEKELLPAFLKKIGSQLAFDRWHRKVCEEMKTLYAKQGVDFTYGQAQKWLNMTIKYLYMLDLDSFEECFSYFHVPLDSYVFKLVKKQFGITEPASAWSRLDDYDAYLTYQEMIRVCLPDIAPLRWEFREWLSAVQE